jgi:hypothetical protein
MRKYLDEHQANPELSGPMGLSENFIAAQPHLALVLVLT